MKNRYKIEGDIVTIFLNTRKRGVLKTIISLEDLPRAQEYPYTWVANVRKNGEIYVHSSTGDYLHRWIMKCPAGKIVDHDNHNTLDNTRPNLKVTTVKGNGENRKGAPSNSTTGVRGVTIQNGRYKAQFRHNKKKIHVGYFGTLEEASKAVEEARSKAYAQAKPH